MSTSQLGCGLAVGQLFLVQEIVGSNPTTPANHSHKTHDTRLAVNKLRGFRGLWDRLIWADVSVSGIRPLIARSSGKPISAIRETGISESCDALTLRLPVRRQVVTQAPV